VDAGVRCPVLFQAEDGIRDDLVTGVQTCALPICVAVRAVAIRGQFAARIQVYDANIVAETLDFPPGQGFDLIVATNVLVYYNRLEQALAMANIARLLNPGGIFLANNPLPSEPAR